MSKVRIICHVVFATKHRIPAINKMHKRELFAYIMGILDKHNCPSIRINGMADHIHILFVLHPTKSLSEIVRAIKLSTNQWLKQNPDFPQFTEWGEGYFATSVTPEQAEACKQYIINQESHHAIYPFFTEIEKLVLKNGLDWDPRNWQ